MGGGRTGETEASGDLARVQGWDYNNEPSALQVLSGPTDRQTSHSCPTVFLLSKSNTQSCWMFSYKTACSRFKTSKKFRDHRNYLPWCFPLLRELSGGCM